MIYEITPFFNELDLLDIKLNENKGIVDKHIIIESDKTHTGIPKKLFFEENQDRYKEHLNRIIHLVHHGIEIKDKKDTWINERGQRDLATPKIKEFLKPNDIIIVTDLDEIISKEGYKKIISNKGPRGAITLRFFYYYMNLEAIDPWPIPSFCRGSNFKSADELRIRTTKPQPNTITDYCGWHWTWLGGADKVLEKCKAFAHQELSEMFEINHIKKSIKDKVYMFNKLSDKHNGYHRRCLQSRKLIKREVSELDLPEFVTNNFNDYKKYFLL